MSSEAAPFFIAAGFIRPHLPYVAPAAFWDMAWGNDAPFPLADSSPSAPSAPAPLGSNGAHELAAYVMPPATPGATVEETAAAAERLFGGRSGPREKGRPLAGSSSSSSSSAALARVLRHGYAASAAFADDCAGRVVKQLEALRLDECTIVVAWGDHGFKLGDDNCDACPGSISNLGKGLREQPVVAAPPPHTALPGRRPQPVGQERPLRGGRARAPGRRAAHSLG